MDFRKKYLLAIVLTSLLIITNQVIIQYFLAQKRYDAKVINVSGKQRMLSQRLMGLVHHYHIKRSEQTKKDIRQNFDEWEYVHYGLISGNKELKIKRLSKEIISKVEAITPNIIYAKEILDKIENLNTGDLEQFKNNQSVFLMNMDKVVKSLEKASDKKLTTIIITEIILASLTLLVLCGEVLWVFVPTVRELSSQNKTLRENNEILKEYAHVASHDLRNPIINISSFSKLLRRKAAHKLDNDELKYLDFITKGADRMNEITIVLLAYATADKVKKSKVDFRQLVQNVIVDIQFENESKGNIKMGQMPEYIVADKNLMKLLFENLISNAIKFMPKDKQPQIEISSKREKNVYTFKIKDNGIGIADSDEQKIFGIFKRLHNQKEYIGTGVGLALCKRIVEGHQGEIWVESTKGQGSTFYFTIPV